jgi:hypothetical protein
METRIKYLADVKTLKDYSAYAIDTEGNVWTMRFNKQKKLSPGYKKEKRDKYVRLTDRFGRIKNFSVGRLVALAFLPTDNIDNRVTHKNGDVNDNRLENLEWHEYKPKANDSRQMIHEEYIIDRFILDKIRKVYIASIHKGLPVPDNNTFFNTIIEGALDSYIMQYGLRRFMQ